jgi:hypothetical protein
VLLPVERTKQPFTHYRYASPAGGGRCAIADIRLHAVDAVVSGTCALLSVLCWHGAALSVARAVCVLSRRARGCVDL